MNRFNIIKADRVVCEQVFKLQDIECNLPIRTSEFLSMESFVNKEKSRVTVSVSHCELCIDEVNNKFFVNLEVLICKDLFINNGLDADIPVKLSYCKSFRFLEITECCPDIVPDEIKDRLRCEVFSVMADDKFYLHPEERTFNQELSITVIVKIIFEDEIEITPPTPFTLIPLQPVISGEVITSLDLAAGKIRSQIGKRQFKQELLNEIAKVKTLLLSGNATGALALLAAIKEQVLVKLNSHNGYLISANLVLGDLATTEKLVINLL